MTYNANHLSTEEVKAVASAIHKQIMDETSEQDILSADLEELSEEYSFWATELENRLDYERYEEIKDDTDS